MKDKTCALEPPKIWLTELWKRYCDLMDEMIELREEIWGEGNRLFLKEYRVLEEKQQKLDDKILKWEEKN